MQRILNIVGWIGFALVAVAVALRFWGPAEWQFRAFVMMWTGVGLVLLYPFSLLTRRQLKNVSLAATSVLVVLGILILANYLSNRRYKRWDLTANAVHTLSEQSQKVVAGLDAPLKILLFDQSDRFPNYRDRLTQYQNASSQLSVEYVDGTLDPVRAKQYEVQAFPTLVLLYKDKTEKVQSVDEREITSALIRVMSGTQRKAYFVQGHGERDPMGESPLSYRGVAQLLKGDNFGVETLALSQTKNVPDDATVVIIAGPTADFLPEELEQIRQYLAKGGKLLLLLDPPLGERPQPLTGLLGLAKEWGVDVGNDVVLDVSGRSQRPELVVVVDYPKHSITESFRVGTIFPLARSVTPVMPAPPGKTVQPIVESARQAWSETDLKALQSEGSQPEPNADKGDKEGPVSIAVAISTPAPPADAKPDDPKTPPQSRFVIFGDSDFASDAVAGSVGNIDLFLNTISWLTAQENLISIRPKEPGNSRLTITPGEMNMVWWFSVAGVPLVVLLVGIISWSQRRRS